LLFFPGLKLWTLAGHVVALTVQPSTTTCYRPFARVFIFDQFVIDTCFLVYTID
jgi:hypothetical protein